MRKIIALLNIGIALCLMLTGCNTNTSQKEEIYVFAAASLKGVMEEIEKNYEFLYPDVDIILNCDSSGVLMTQIKEGHTCDIFFSASTKQMDALEKENLVIPQNKINLLSNQLVLIKGKGVDSQVTGLTSIGQAKSIALATSSVPAGDYTRRALQALELLPTNVASHDVTGAQIMEIFDGITVSEQGNVSKVLAAVSEGACEVGTTYYSDVYGYQDKVEIIEPIESNLTGDILYPVAMILNDNTQKEHQVSVEQFFSYLTDDTQKQLFEQYYFIWYEE